MTTVTPVRSSGCALIIGINDYRIFDATGARNLVGGTQDVIAVQRICGRLGMAPEDIVCLYDDLAGPGQEQTLPPKEGCAPTRQGILAALDRLRTQLESGKKGLLWYSAHGAWTEGEGLLLCPGDIAPGPGGKGFVNALSFQELGNVIGAKAARNLTVVLDCCHGGPAQDAHGRRSTTLSNDPPDPVRWSRDHSLFIGATVLTACAPGETTQQSCFTGRPHGAFSWALLAAIDQWTVKRQRGGNVYIDLTYRELIKAAMQLLSALDFEGTPQVWPQYQGSLAVLEFGDDDLGTSDQPDAARHCVQLDPNSVDGGTLYVFTLSYEQKNAGQSSTQQLTQQLQVLACGSQVTYNGQTYNSGTEYWNITYDFNQAWSDANATNKTLTVTSTSFTGSDVPQQWTGSAYSPERLANMQGGWAGYTDGTTCTTLWCGQCGIDFANEGKGITVNWYYSGSTMPTASYFITNTTAPYVSFGAPPPNANFVLTR